MHVIIMDNTPTIYHHSDESQMNCLAYLEYVGSIWPALNQDSLTQIWRWYKESSRMSLRNLACPEEWEGKDFLDLVVKTLEEELQVQLSIWDRDLKCGLIKVLLARTLICWSLLLFLNNAALAMWCLLDHDTRVFTCTIPGI